MLVPLLDCGQGLSLVRLCLFEEVLSRHRGIMEVGRWLGEKERRLGERVRITVI